MKLNEPFSKLLIDETVLICKEITHYAYLISSSPWTYCIPHMSVKSNEVMRLEIALYALEW